MVWNKGKKWNAETRKKISESLKGRKPWNKGKVGMMPVPHNKGKHLSEETKAKISASRKGQRAWNDGLKWDAETKEKIRQSKLKYHAQRKV